MVGWHHLNGYESEQTLDDGEGQGSMVCCSSPCRRVEHDLVTDQQGIVIYNMINIIITSQVGQK